MNNIKRMMYVSGEDFYVMTYVTLFLLNDLIGKKAKSKKFKDHRKISLLIQIISDSRLIDLINRYENREVNNNNDRDFLFDSFANAGRKKVEVEKLLKVLDSEGYINLIRTNTVEVYDISLGDNAIPDALLNSDAFLDIREDVALVKSVIKRLNVLSYEKFIENVYKSRGINAWAF
ncbi:hypothetical protein L4D06_19765 [Enterovibrio makurazakiensis]|uniref:hypothetical protein n=1 Tax=Enterovibrio makurazakiensis TaxID=2910232 RepID=UPI003D207CFD